MKPRTRTLKKTNSPSWRKMAGVAAETTTENVTTSKKTKKPNDSAFKQQRLPAWQPILTAGTVMPTFFVIGIAFVPIGIGMLWFSDHVHEFEYDYTDCSSGGESCASIINGTDIMSRSCVCVIDFNIDVDWEGDVFLYYGLGNFFQNHRRYVKSRDDRQLLGLLSDHPSDNCKPFLRENETGKVYVPCGAIANSLFSDEIQFNYYDSEKADYLPVPVLRTGIAWDSDLEFKFRNPVIPEGETLESVLRQYAKPKDWKKNLWELDLENPDNNGLQNQDLIVWMRTAALPNFRKLYRRVDHSKEPFLGKLPKNKYQFVITYNFEVKQFAGRKRVVLSTTSLLGGKNPFLGIAYIVVGCFCIILGVVFLIVHLKYGKRSNDMINITSREPYTN